MQLTCKTLRIMYTKALEFFSIDNMEIMLSRINIICSIFDDKKCIVKVFFAIENLKSLIAKIKPFIILVFAFFVLV